MAECKVKKHYTVSRASARQLQVARMAKKQSTPPISCNFSINSKCFVMLFAGEMNSQLITYRGVASLSNNTPVGDVLLGGKSAPFLS